MLDVSSVLPDDISAQPSIILVHGAATSAGVWTFWQRELAASGRASHALDLRGHGQSDGADLSHTSMSDYASDLRSVAEEFARPPVLMGWSMGGLLAMMVAAAVDAVACVALAPSAPAKRRDSLRTLRAGEFGPEEYGITSLDPGDQPEMPDLDQEEREIALASLSRESRLARDERAAGIVVEPPGCPLLIVTGASDTRWPPQKYDDLPLEAEFHNVAGASHWGLVLSRRAIAAATPVLLRWLAKIEA